MAQIKTKEELSASLDRIFTEIKTADMHTHLFAPCFKSLFLYGLDEMLNYHYLISEMFRHNPGLSYDEFNAMPRKRQAEVIWKTLFVDRLPVSEVTCSIITVFKALGLDVSRKDIEYYRSYFANANFDEYVEKVFAVAGIEYVVMTNDPFCEEERNVWENSYKAHPRFKTALRLDVLVNNSKAAFPEMKRQGYNVTGVKALTPEELSEIRRFLKDWAVRMKAMYMAASMCPDFTMTDGSARALIIDQCVLPVCRELKIPFAVMIGVKRAVNPDMKLAGDSIGKSDIKTVEYLCSNYPDNKFLLTMLSLENQHEAIVTSRKFKNLMLFGCWWFVNNPTLIEYLTSLRLEMLGTSFIPQHSDCRVFEQLISKWIHSKVLIKNAVIKRYGKLLEDGYFFSEEELEKEMKCLFSDNFKAFIER